MSLHDDFKKASTDVQSLKKKPADAELLELYALYKQANEGDVQGARPGILNLVGRKKFDAWAEKKGLSRDQAMQKYISFVQQLQKKS